MKTKGSTSYVLVKLGDLKKSFNDDLKIMVSRRFLRNLCLNTGIQIKPEEVTPTVVDTFAKQAIVENISLETATDDIISFEDVS